MRKFLKIPKSLGIKSQVKSSIDPNNSQIRSLKKIHKYQSMRKAKKKKSKRMSSKITKLKHLPRSMLKKKVNLW